MGLESICFGLPARGEAFTRGVLRQRFEISRAGRPVLLERGRFIRAAARARGGVGLAAACVHGLLVALARDRRRAVVAALRARWRRRCPSGDLAAVTTLAGGDVLVCRYLGGSAERARRFFHDGWRSCGPRLIGRAATAPRIWAT